jgi:hypothetical protein
MPTTKPARQRTGILRRRRKAPAYKRLDRDAYAQLDRYEQARHDMHVDIDAVIDAIDFALIDRAAITWPSDIAASDARRGGGQDTRVEAGIDVAGRHAREWLAEMAEMRGLVTKVARLARFYYGFDPARGRDEPGRPAKSSGEKCAWCDGPIVEGRDSEGHPLVRRVDQRPVHASPCYWAASNQARAAGMSVASTIAATNATNAKTAGR